MFKMKLLNRKLLKITTLLFGALILSACEWPSYTSTISNFTDDPQFDRNLESNKIHTLTNLHYFTPSTVVVLQCLNSSNTWTTLGNGTPFTNPDGSFTNYNGNTPSRVVYGFNWDGNWINQIANNCNISTTALSAPKTTDWTYSHTQKSLTLRFTDLSGKVFANFNDQERTCFSNDPSTDMWQRFADCNVSSNDQYFAQPIDEQITRVSNYGTISASFGSSADQWSCNWYVFIDGIPQKINAQGVQMVYGRDGGNMPQTKTQKGTHTVKFDRNGLTCYPTGRSCPSASTCVSDSVYVNASSPCNGPGFCSNVAQENRTGSATKIFQVEVK